jgi:hypothetical protein
MRQFISMVLGVSAVMIGGAALAQTPAAPGSSDAKGKSGANVGQLECKVAGGMGFIFGSSKDLSCLFVRTDGIAEKYTGSIKRFGVDIGYTKEAHMIWLVFAPGKIDPGALTGGYVGATVQATVGGGVGANVLIGGGNKQISLQPVSVEGSVGLNVAGGVAEVELKYVK